MARCWQDLGGAEAGCAHQALWKLVAAAGQAIPWIGKECGDVPSSTVARLIHRLDHQRYAVRARATKELDRLADQAEPALRQALTRTESLEVYQRLVKLL